MALFDVRDGTLHLVEIADGVSLDELKAATAADFTIPDHDLPVF
jgi:acyl CoA:acetate/3-ketoacid CoA transferase beta subunit